MALFNSVTTFVAVVLTLACLWFLLPPSVKSLLVQLLQEGGQTDGRTNGRKIFPFYRTSYPTEAAAPLHCYDKENLNSTHWKTSRARELLTVWCLWADDGWKWSEVTGKTVQMLQARQKVFSIVPECPKMSQDVPKCPLWTHLCPNWLVSFKSNNDKALWLILIKLLS